MRRATAALAASLLLLATAGAPAFAAASSHPRVSFTQAQQQFMCTICGEPLNEARSPEAYNENAELRRLIGRGETLAQIKREMVVQYGSAVLSDPPKRGFSLLLVVIPAVVVALGIAVVAVTIPRWRRRAAAAAAEPRPPDPAVSDEDARRLNADLAREP